MKFCAIPRRLCSCYVIIIAGVHRLSLRGAITHFVGHYVIGLVTLISTVTDTLAAPLLLLAAPPS